MSSSPVTRQSAWAATAQVARIEDNRGDRGAMRHGEEVRCDHRRHRPGRAAACEPADERFGGTCANDGPHPTKALAASMPCAGS